MQIRTINRWRGGAHPRDGWGTTHARVVSRGGGGAALGVARKGRAHPSATNPIGAAWGRLTGGAANPLPPFIPLPRPTLCGPMTGLDAAAGRCLRSSSASVCSPE